MTIGLVIFGLYNRFFAQLANAIEMSAREQGYFVYLTLTDRDKKVEKSCIEHLAGRQVDGLIICSVHSGKEYYEYLEGLKIPIITIGNRIFDRLSFVGIDDYMAMKEAANHIINKKYGRIIYFSPPLSNRGKVNLHAQEERFRGYCDALKEAGRKIESLVIEEDSGIARICSYGLNTNERTAVLCSSDVYALEILNHFEKYGISVPKGMGLMGFDNIDMLKYVKPSLATVSYPLLELGTKAVELLLAEIRGASFPQDIKLAHTIIKGKSL